MVEELKAGNTLVLDQVVEALREPLLAYAQKRLDGCGDAEDIVQEAFLRFWNNRGRLQPDGSIRALLFCTVRTLVADEHRRWRRRSHGPLQISWSQESDSPLDSLLSSELEQMAENAVHHLPPRRKAIWLMVRENGLSHRETADALGVSTQTVANTMSSALADMRFALRNVLEEAS